MRAARQQLDSADTVVLTDKLEMFERNDRDLARALRESVLICGKGNCGILLAVVNRCENGSIAAQENHIQ
jgi:hypothetical protein